MTHGPSDYKKRLGDRLAELMRAAGVEKLDAAETLECSESKVARILRGGVGVSPSDLDKLLDLLEVKSPERDELKQLGREAGRRRPPTPWGSAVPDGLRKYFPAEETAREIRAYQAELVHGLVQTEDYARALIAANPMHRPGDVPRLVQARMARQTRLFGPNPPQLHLMFSEGAVRRVVGGRAVMESQLRQLIELRRQKHVTIQVIPFDVGAHASAGFSFTLFTPPDRPVVAYVENVTDGLFVSEAGRLESYELIWQALVTCALSPSASIRLLDTVARHL